MVELVTRVKVTCNKNIKNECIMVELVTQVTCNNNIK